MASLLDKQVRKLLDAPNYAVISTLDRDGSVHSTIIWISAEDDAVAVNSALGRKWPSNLQRDPRVTVLVQEDGNPYEFVEIRGTATATREGADEHIDALAKKYTGEDRFQDRRAGQERIKFVIRPERVRYVNQA
ncbi:MAG: PPOX class F420-dependent oxidoreductase [Actinomycetota bacterium]|nr:PPOX class F420-dependent oxidoreductase [Actinomycetota bacterium]